MPRVFFIGLIVSFGLFVGRLSGFFREVFISSVYGASAYSDLVIVLLTIPDVLVSLLVGGALGMALIPEFSDAKTGKANLLYLQVLYLMFGFFAVATFALSFFSWDLLRIFSPGLSVNLFDDGQHYLRISLCAIPFTVAAGVTTAFLNYNQKFVVPAFSTLIFNSVLIFILCFYQYFKLGIFYYYLVGGIVLGAVVRWGSLLINDGFNIYKKNLFSHFLVSKNVFNRYLSCVISGGFIFLVPVIVRAAASNHGAGALSITNYALKLVELPLAVVLTVFSIVLVPRFSRLFVAGQNERFSELLTVVTVILTFMSLIICISLEAFSIQFVSLVYGWGVLSLSQLAEISEVFKIALYSLTFQGLNAFFLSACAARKDTFLPFLLTSVVVVIFIIASYFFDLSLRNLIILMNLTYSLITLGLVVILLVRHKLISVLNFYFLKKISIAFLIALTYSALLSSSIFSDISPINAFVLCAIGGCICLVIFFLANFEFLKMVKTSE